MKFVVVRNKTKIVGKEVYAGDTSDLDRSLIERTTKDADLSFDVYEESAKEEFEAIQLGDGQDKSDYKALVSVSDKVDYLATKLGLL